MLAYLGGLNDLADRFLDVTLTSAGFKSTWDQPFEEAIRWFLSKRVITKAEFERKLERLKPKWFTVAQLQSESLVRQVRDEVAKALENGTGVQEFIDDLGAMFDRLGVGRLEQWHARQVYLQNAQNSFHAGFAEALFDPSVAGDFPFLQYVTMDDDRVRDTHQALHGLIFRRDELGDWYPPNGFGCRCTVIPISADEAAEQGIEADVKPDFVERDGRLIPVIPDRGFQSNPVDAFYEVPDIEG